MEKEEFIKIMDSKLKLIRIEFGLTQDKMSGILGISKKTLVEIEKNRKSLGWTGSVALASIFSDSTLLRDAMGGDMGGIIIAVAFKDVVVDYPQTWGGKIWWDTVSEKNGYKIQQNILSQHFRLLDKNDRRIFSGFELKEVEEMREDMLNSKR
ncbi:MAG: helix-turn-helix domain-containing protein [Clostridiaceae bacterium]